MVQLNRNVLLCSAVVAIFCVYLQQTGYRPFQSLERIEAELDSYTAASQATDAFILYSGRTIFLIAVIAWGVLIVQSLFNAVRRYRHTPSAVPPLQPVNQQQPVTSDTTTTAAAGPSRLQLARIQPQQQTSKLTTEQQQQLQVSSGHDGDLDERRRRAAEAKQKQLDEAAAARREQQQREEAQRKQLAAQAAAAAAQQRRQREEAQRALQAADLERWAQWEQAVVQHYRRSPESASNEELVELQTQAAGSADAAEQPAATAQMAEEDRQLREQQDQEYQASLAADRKQQQQKQQRQLLQHLKQLLQHSLQEEPRGVAAHEGLTVRVKVPDGTTAVRLFVAEQPLAEVYEWVFSLPAMPCLIPGIWSLSTTFPKQSLMPPDGIWAQDSCSSDDKQLLRYIQQKEAAMGYGAAMAAADDIWCVSVRQLSGDEFPVLVHDDSTILDVKKKTEMRTGIPASSQRLIFSGHILPDDASLKQLGITAQHILQLATGAAAQQQPQTTQSAPSKAEDLADSGGVLSGLSSTCGDILVLSDVQQLRQHVAHGAPQLALYVVVH